MAKQLFRFHYRRNLVMMLIFLQLLTVTSILLLSRINIDRLLINNAYDTIAKTIAQSVEQSRSFLKPAYQTSETLKTLASNRVINFADINTVEKLFFTELKDNSNFAGIYIANDRGDFVYVLRNELSTDQDKQSIDHTFQTKIIQNIGNNRQVTFRWRNPNFGSLREEAVTGYAFNPKLRPWYQLAISEQRMSWTEPYTFFTSQKRGVTIATPYHNQATGERGVVGIDIELDELSSFLDRINDANYYIQIMDAQDHLIAESSSDNVLKKHDIQNLIYDKSGNIGQMQGTFVESEEEFLFVHKSLLTASSHPSLPEWRIFTYAKTAPFLTQVRAIEKRNIAIALATFLLSVLISLLIANRTSKPVENWMNQATTDSLTELYNRHFFFNAGNKIFSEYNKNPNHRLALMMIDVDLFKRINDSYGHSIGDDVLTALARCLKALTKEEDLLARFGGEEFILLTKIETTREAAQLSEQIRQAIENLKIETNAGTINVTVSIGVAITNLQVNLSFMEFIDHADRTLYESKHSGRNRVSIANKDDMLRSLPQHPNT